MVPTPHEAEQSDQRSQGDQITPESWYSVGWGVVVIGSLVSGALVIGGLVSGGLVIGGLFVAATLSQPMQFLYEVTSPWQVPSPGAPPRHILARFWRLHGDHSLQLPQATLQEM